MFPHQFLGLYSNCLKYWQANTYYNLLKNCFREKGEGLHMNVKHIKITNEVFSKERWVNM